MRQDYTLPYYRYDLNVLNQTLDVAQENAQRYGFELKYALKANQNKRVVKLIKQKGLGVDCVSKEEIAFALSCGWKPCEVVFAGSGKTIYELTYALEQNIGVIHCESVEEFKLIEELRETNHSTSSVALRINPNLKVGTHQKISTGEKQHKFGMSFEDAYKLLKLHPSIIGLHIHVGSQVLDLIYFEHLSMRVSELIAQLPSNYNLSYLNMGGGLGINYKNPERDKIADFEGWMKAIRKHLPNTIINTIVLEPGRSIVGQCGQLIGQVQYVKKNGVEPTLILDVGMTEILRPALYGARHKISAHTDALYTQKYTVSGPSCESSDTFGAGFELPELKRGDLLVIHSCGAYTESMRLQYNLKKPLEVYYIELPVFTKLKQTNYELVA